MKENQKTMSISLFESTRWMVMMNLGTLYFIVSLKHLSSLRAHIYSIYSSKNICFLMCLHVSWDLEWRDGGDF